MARSRFLVMVYGRWGSEPYGFYSTLEKAKEKAQTGSSLDPANEYVIEDEPGGSAIVYKAGKRLGGERDKHRSSKTKRSHARMVKKRTDRGTWGGASFPKRKKGVRHMTPAELYEVVKYGVTARIRQRAIDELERRQNKATPASLRRRRTGRDREALERRTEGRVREALRRAETVWTSGPADQFWGAGVRVVEAKGQFFVISRGEVVDTKSSLREAVRVARGFERRAAKR